MKRPSNTTKQWTAALEEAENEEKSALALSHKPSEPAKHEKIDQSQMPDFTVPFPDASVEEIEVIPTQSDPPEPCIKSWMLLPAKGMRILIAKKRTLKASLPRSSKRMDMRFKSAKGNPKPPAQQTDPVAILCQKGQWGPGAQPIQHQSV